MGILVFQIGILFLIQKSQILREEKKVAGFLQGTSGVEKEVQIILSGISRLALDDIRRH